MKIYKISTPLNILFLFPIVFASLFVWQKNLDSRAFSSIIVDGSIISDYSEGHTITQFLNEHNISLNEKDIIAPSLTSPLPQGGKIKITRYADTIKTESRTLPLKIKKRTPLSQNLRKVELQKVVQNTAVKTTKTTYKNGNIYKKELLSEHFIKKTFFQLALIDPEGKVEKVYDLSKCKKMKMIATAYFPGDPLCWKDGTETFLGHRMQRGIVAVDPKVIPLRTRVFIPGYGYGFAGDTGSAIKGNRIDLGFNDDKEDLQWLYKPVTVYILEKSKKW